MISAVVIGKDQSATLDACLQSLAGVEEVVYLDTGSTDGSRELAAKRGARLLNANGLSGGGPLRNYAAATVRNPWVLSLSCDDVLEEGGVEKIKHLVSNGGAAESAFNCTVVQPTGECNVFPRLVRKERQWHGRAHEHLMGPCGVTADITIKHLRGPWHDKPSDPLGILRALWADLQDEPENPRWLYYYARAHYYRNDWITAAHWFQKRVGIVGFPPEMADAYLYLARCQWHLACGGKAHAAEAGRARQNCLLALSINPQFKEAALFMAELALPAHRAQWQALANGATNQDVLFVRPPFHGGLQKP